MRVVRVMRDATLRDPPVLSALREVGAHWHLLLRRHEDRDREETCPEHKLHGVRGRGLQHCRGVLQEHGGARREHEPDEEVEARDRHDVGQDAPEPDAPGREQEEDRDEERARAQAVDERKSEQ